MAKGLGASLWAWLNKPDAVAYLERTLEDEREKRRKAEASEKELQRREKELQRRASDFSRDLSVAERELVKLREVYAVHLATHADLVVRFAKMAKEKAEFAKAGERDFRISVDAVLDAGTYLGLAESYAAENDELRRLMGNARNQLDGRRRHPEDSPICVMA